MTDATSADGARDPGRALGVPGARTRSADIPAPDPLGAVPPVGFCRADRSDLSAAREMHHRCSPDTLRSRYRSPAEEADRLLDHLLSPHFGQTLAARTASGQVVALGHLLWDGDEAEVALLVEDEWQRRGIGTELLRRLLVIAADQGCSNVYAVMGATNAGMAAAMSGLDLPVEHRLEDEVLVVTARLPQLPSRPAVRFGPLEPAPRRAPGRGRPTGLRCSPARRTSAADGRSHRRPCGRRRPRSGG